MARQKKEIHKVEMTDGKRAIIQQLFQEYNIESATDIQDALKDLLGGTSLMQYWQRYPRAMTGLCCWKIRGSLNVRLETICR
ncbi:hypothetical protein SAMN05216582_14010 [Selenomonas ruminantium]|uniref:Uncharacterized protein n=1 Tax=Selenomonas ruminantium TaxID=971 RepID=A0A1M6XP16_SELRU|nr:hypothetical protein [Selenomonas ruminantium]SHL07760.1 hypothetical protein SAMN05216582_14010 [Selenomonas ruminantium]